jgi:hypothetical protein
MMCESRQMNQLAADEWRRDATDRVYRKIRRLLEPLRSLARILRLKSHRLQLTAFRFAATNFLEIPDKRFQKDGLKLLTLRVPPCNS